MIYNKKEVMKFQLFISISMHVHIRIYIIFIIIFIEKKIASHERLNGLEQHRKTGF